MSPDTARWIRMLLTAIVSGMITGIGVIHQGVTSEGQIHQSTIINACILGSMSLFTSLSAYLAQPPPSLGGTALPEAAPPLPPPLPLPLAGSALDPRVAVPSRIVLPGHE